MKKIGQILLDKRVERNLSIDDVSSILKIKPQFIHLIEKDRPEEFSSKVYYIGFLKQYTKFLGIESSNDINIEEKSEESLKIANNFIDNFAPNFLVALAASIFTIILYLTSSNILSKKGSNLIAQEFNDRKTNLVRLQD